MLEEIFIINEPGSFRNQAGKRSDKKKKVQNNRRGVAFFAKARRAFTHGIGHSCAKKNELYMKAIGSL